MDILPWTEKYRPCEASAICGNAIGFQKVLDAGNIGSNILLYGPPGTGKSTAIRALVRNVSTESILTFDTKLKSSGASKHINRVLDHFINKKTSSYLSYVIVDEVDTMYIQDQKVFIQSMMKKNDISQRLIIFVFICNKIEKVSNFIKRHSVIVKYDEFPFEVALPYLRNICVKEQVKHDVESLKFIFITLNCDMRKVVSTIQYLHLMSDLVNKEEFLKMETVDFINYDDEYFNTIFKMPMKSAIDELFYQSFSVISLSLQSFRYHQRRNIMTKEYLKKLAYICDDALTTRCPYFLISQLIIEAPAFQDLTISII
jgi:DNA polymerase III delta prime subunit